MSLRRSPLIDAHELQARIDHADLRVADVRWCLGDPDGGRRAYEAGHVPGAIFIDLDRDLAAPTGPGRHPLPDPADFAAHLGALGIGDTHTVVVYDDVGGTVAARLWWMLDRLGHPDVALLDGGIAAWVRAGGELETATVTHPPADFRLATTWPDTVDREAIREASGRLDLVDLRAGERYRGEVEPVDPVAGHIPGARSLPAAGLLGDDGRLLEPETLAARLADAGGAGPGTPRPLVMSCGSGVTACFGALAARVAGLPDPLVYPGSYSDWSSAGLPVATGDEPGAIS